MTRFFAQLSVIISVSLMLTACPSNEGAKSVEVADILVAGPLPKGLPVFIEINEPFWAHDDEDTEKFDSLSLYSVKLPGDGEVATDPVSIFTTSSDQVTSLNTVDDDSARTEISILVNEGNVYKVDHLNGSIRLLNHFVNKVCEIIPVDIVETTSINNNTDVTHTVLHDELIYVVTVDGAVTASDCADPSKLKRFYELPLNYQFDVADDDETRINKLKPPVSEALARAKMVFGWVDDENGDADNNDDQRLTYGYLGYSIAEKKLRFFDEERDEIWCQPRSLQTFAVEEVEQDTYSLEYLFKLTELDQQQYMLQLGLDVFVFDSTSELFSKPSNVSYCDTVDEQGSGVETGVEAENIDKIKQILTDRIFKTGTTTIAVGESNTSEIVTPVTVLFDNDDLLFVQSSKIFRYNYLESDLLTVPTQTRNFEVKKQNPVSIDQIDYRRTLPFSQFDVSECDESADVAACGAAHNLEASGWQFITGCDVDKGCTLPSENSDYCTTTGIECSAGDYRHLNELNNASNDAEFRGFMQYDVGYIRSLSYTLHDNSLFITARLNEKEILLRYFYNIDLSEAKVDREHVLLGARIKHFGVDVYFNESNLFATVLWKNQKRENECYKNYQQVECLLSNDEDDDGLVDGCTANDISEGECVNGFQEYKSVALFCTQAEIDGNACTDDQIINTDNLLVTSIGQDAKWLRMFDVGGRRSVMYLLTDDQESVQDEGVLTDPQLHAVDNSSGEPSTTNTLGRIEGKVESVIDGWISDNNQARFDVLTEEVELSEVIQTQGVRSVSNIHFVTDPKLSNSATPSDPDDDVNKQLVNAGTVKVLRTLTQFDSEE